MNLITPSSSASASWLPNLIRKFLSILLRKEGEFLKVVSIWSAAFATLVAALMSDEVTKWSMRLRIQDARFSKA